MIRLPRLAVMACLLGACAAPVPEATRPVPAAPLAAPALEGTRWVMAGAPAGDAAAARLEFTPAGRVSGFTGCNLLGGSYRLEEDRLEAVVATTKRACLGPGGEHEEKLLAVLGDRPRVRIEQGRLVLTGSRGASFVLERTP